VTLNLAETLVVKSRPSVPHGANLFSDWFGWMMADFLPSPPVKKNPWDKWHRFLHTR